MGHEGLPQESDPGSRWFNPLQLGGEGEIGALSRRPVIFAFALMAVGLVVALVPARVDSAALGDLANAGSARVVPALCFLVGDLCLTAGVWAVIMAVRGRPLERIAVAVTGVVSAALTGNCVRLVWQIVLLREFYRPALFFTSPARAAAVGWGLLLTAVLTTGFLAPLLVAAANLLPRVIADKLRLIRWLAGRRWWLLLSFAALAATVVISQWVLPQSLATAMGYSIPSPSGGLVTISVRDVGPAAWGSLRIVFALPLLVLMWEGVEAARTCQRLVRKPGGGETPLLARVQRFDYRLATVAVIIAVGWFAIAKSIALTALAGVALLVIIALSFSGELGGAVRLAKGFERAVSRWELPEDWRDLGRISLLLAILGFPVLIVLCGNVGLGAKAGLWFPSDLAGFYFYWHSYGFINIPVVTASDIYGHVEAVIWGTSLVLAALVLLGMILNAFDKQVRDGFRVIWFLLRVGALAFVLAPVARLTDHAYATFVLAGGAVVAVLVISVVSPRRLIRPAAVWSAILIGGALVLWSLALWRTAWVPAAVILCLTILQRFAFNAGKLNDPGKYRPNRVAYFQGVALVSVAMLILGHGATNGYFKSDALSAVSDHVSLSVVAVIWLVTLVIRQAPRSPRPEPVKELPRSWAGLLDPHQALVGFAGREDELAVLLAWCEDEQAPRLRLVTGCGGIGKTRLAVELAARVTARGWPTTWVAPGQEAAAVAAVPASAAGRALLVVDEAETRTGLQRLLAALASSPSPGVRVLLLARWAGGWLDQAAAGSPAAWNLVQLARQAVLALPKELDAGKPDHKIVSEAVGSIARKFGLRESRIETRYKTSAPRDEVLELHSAALVATLTDASLVETGTGTVQADLRTSGLDQLLRHEQQFWYDSAREQGLPGAAESMIAARLRQVIAVNCLFRASTIAEAADLAAARVPELPPSSVITKWLEDLSAATRDGTGKASFLPGRLAELHTLRELNRPDPEFTAACFGGLTARQALEAVIFLARAVPDYREASALLSKMLPDVAGHVADLPAPAETLVAMLTVLPSPSPALAPAAAAVTRRLLGFLPTRTEPSARAYWLAHLGLRLAETGDLQEAVAAEQEAITIYRELTIADPGRHLPDLVVALDNVGEWLNATGESGEAVLAAEEAVTICRDLATVDPGLYGPALARALTSLSLRRHEMGQSARCLSAAQEAARVYRELAATNPGQYDPGLARALTSLALRYHELGRFADALPAAEEGISVYRRLVTTDPRRYRPALAGALDNLGVYLSKLGRPTDALPVTKEAVALYGELAKGNPGLYRTDLTRAQGNLRFRYRELDRVGKK